HGQIGDNNYKGLDVDLYKVQLNAGDQVSADIDAVAFGSSLDTILRIFDASGRPLAADDDAIGGGTDSHLEFVATSAGTYYLGVSGFVNGLYDPLVEGSGRFGNSTGEYTIQIDVGPRPVTPIKVTLANGDQRGGVNFASS